MGLILRVDVDKPYGHSNLFYKIISKISEDFWFPNISFIYLFHLKCFLRYCNKNSVRGYFYHRMCTVPSLSIYNLLNKGNHKIGFHAENTRSIETFERELAKFKSNAYCKTCDSFTKHGSGTYKLGKHHYPPYEENKYIDWARRLQIKFPFGNGIASNSNDFNIENGFYKNMFWLEPEYRAESLSSIEEIIEIAKHQDVPVLIHPCNFYTFKVVRKEFEKLVELAKINNIEWVI